MSEIIPRNSSSLPQRDLSKPNRLSTKSVITSNQSPLPSFSRRRGMLKQMKFPIPTCKPLFTVINATTSFKKIRIIYFSLFSIVYPTKNYDSPIHDEVFHFQLIYCLYLLDCWHDHYRTAFQNEFLSATTLRPQLP